MGGTVKIKRSNQHEIQEKLKKKNRRIYEIGEIIKIENIKKNRRNYKEKIGEIMKKI